MTDLNFTLSQAATGFKHSGDVTQLFRYLWGYQDDLDPLSLRWYNNFFRRESETLQSILNPQVRCTLSMKDLIDLLKLLKDNHDLAKTEIRQKLHDHYTAKGVCNTDEFLELGARLLSMVVIRNHATHYGQGERLPWPENKSLVAILTARFPVLQKTSPNINKESRFGRKFNVYWLERIGDFKIEWTDNLLDHLALNDRVIYLFGHVTILRLLQEAEW